MIIFLFYIVVTGVDCGYSVCDINVEEKHFQTIEAFAIEAQSVYITIWLFFFLLNVLLFM